MRGGNNLQAWETFLQGRIAQEEGRNDEAVKLFDKALDGDSDNRFFLVAKANAEQALGVRGDDERAAVAQIERHYAHLANALIGERDQPEDWIDGLNKLAGIVKAGGRTPEATFVVW